MNLSRQKLLLIRERFAFVVIFVILGFAFNILVYGPLDKKVNKSKVELALLKLEAIRYQASADIDSGVKRLEEVTGEFRALESGLFSSGKLLPPAGDASAILREITVPHPGVTFISIRPSPIEDREAYVVQPLALQIRGSFPSLGGFLSKLDASGRVIDVSRLSIVKDAGEGLLMGLNLEILLLPEMES
jgi:Tfp pilus assembly protein PilO